MILASASVKLTETAVRSSSSLAIYTKLKNGWFLYYSLSKCLLFFMQICYRSEMGCRIEMGIWLSVVMGKWLLKLTGQHRSSFAFRTRCFMFQEWSSYWDGTVVVAVSKKVSFEMTRTPLIASCTSYRICRIRPSHQDGVLVVGSDKIVDILD